MNRVPPAQEMLRRALHSSLFSSNPAGQGRWISPLEEREGMKPDELWTQLATRIPRELHRRLKVYCVTHDVTLMHFVVVAIEEKLGRKTGPKKGNR